MKLENIKPLVEAASKNKDENDDLYKAPAPGQTGEFITSAQAAKIMGVTMARIRQLVGEERIKSYAPVKGQRDHLFKLAEIKAFAKKDRPITGRPPEDDKKKD